METLQGIYPSLLSSLFQMNEAKVVQNQTMHCVFVEVLATKSFFNQTKKKKERTIFLKHPNDNQMGNDISLLCRSHHAKHCLPYFAAAVRENGGGKR